MDSIVEEIDRRFTDFYPNVENVQDIVEKHLMREERYEAAKAYILYRADHHKRREATRLQSAEAARRGCTEVSLEVRTDNMRAQQLYRRYGFRQIGIRKGYYQPSGADALVMRRDSAGSPR